MATKILLRNPKAPQQNGAALTSKPMDADRLRRETAPDLAIGNIMAGESIPDVPPVEIVPPELERNPYPVDALPEPLASFVAAAAEAIGCDPSFVALPVLVVAGAAIGNTRRLKVKQGWDVPPILWGAIVGESGTAKSPAFAQAIKPIEDRQRLEFRKFEEALAAQEGEISQRKKAYSRGKKISKPRSCRRLMRRIHKQKDIKYPIRRYRRSRRYSIRTLEGFWSPAMN